MKNPAYKDIDNYIDSQPVGIRPTLERLRQTIRKAVPEAEEVISYQMPAFKYHGILAYFAVFKDHYSLFIRPGFHRVFKRELAAYSTTKSAIHIPLDAHIPVRLVTRIAKYIARHNEEKQALTKHKRRT